MNVEPEKIRALISILQSMLEPSENAEELDDEPTPVKTKVKTKVKASASKKRGSANTKKTQPKFINKFDSMPEKNLHKDDVAIDKKLCNKPPVPRNRSFEFVDATCRICHKTESINPAILTDSLDRYKCNKCSTSPG